MDKPRRIQRKRTKGWRLPANTVIVDRTSKWGNPFRTGIVGVDIAAYMRLWNTRKGRATIQRELRGKNLCCWCKLDQPCHADVLLEIANG